MVWVMCRRGESRQEGQFGTVEIINTLNQTKEATSWKADFILGLHKLWDVDEGIL